MATEGLTPKALEAKATSRSEARGLLGMADADLAPVYTGPGEMTLHVTIAADGAAPEGLRALVEAAPRQSPIPDAVDHATAAGAAHPDRRGPMDALSETLRVVHLVGAISSTAASARRGAAGRRTPTRPHHDAQAPLRRRRRPRPSRPRPANASDPGSGMACAVGPSVWPALSPIEPARDPWFLMARLA